MNVNNSFEFSPEQQQKRLMKTCEDFESFFHKMILKAGRNGIAESNLIEKSNAEKIFTDMFDDKISGLAANQATGGIKEMLFDSLKGALEPVDGKSFPGLVEKAYGITDNKGKNSIMNAAQNGIDIAQ